MPRIRHMKPSRPDAPAAASIEARDNQTYPKQTKTVAERDSVTLIESDGTKTDITHILNRQPANTITSPTGDPYKSLWAKLKLYGNPDDRFNELPSIHEFETEEYVKCARVIYQMAEALAEHFGAAFDHFEQFKTDFYWKAKGGQSANRDTLGKCTKPTGLLKQLSECDFIIWFGHDHALARSYTNWEMLQLVHHEMRHTGMNEKQEATIIGHQFEGFLSELEIFGPTGGQLSAIIKTAQQLPLF